MPGVAGRSGGRNAKSTQVHDLEGTRRKERHGDFDTPNPPKIKPEPPNELAGDALAEWDRMLGRLEVCNTLTIVDDAAVYQYCLLFAETEEIASERAEARATLKVLLENRADLKELEVSDRVAFLANVVNLEKLISKCTDQLRAGRMAIRQYLVEFGMTPAARSRVKLPKGAEAPKNKWDGVLQS